MTGDGVASRGTVSAGTGSGGAGTTITAPATNLEQRVAAVWAETLGIPLEQLSTDLGGHSLLAARTASLLCERGIGVGPAVGDIYTHTSIRHSRTISVSSA